MPLPPSFARDLRQNLRNFRAAHGAAAIPSSAGKALEAWLIMRLARHAQTNGWTVTLRTGDGSRLARGAQFKLPAHQAGILPSDPNGPGFVLLERKPQPTIQLDPDGEPEPDIRLELHGGLQWKGRSDATHECDVSVVPQAISGPLRVKGGHPRGLPVAAYECKDRDTAGNPDEMRQTLARLFDLALVTLPYPGFRCRMFEAANHTPWGRHKMQYRSFFEAGAFGIVRVGPFSRGARKIGRHFHIGRHGRVYTDSRTIADIETKFLHAIDSVHATEGL